MNLSLKNITKTFGPKTALDEVSAEFESGRIHALLGENGAGKSTLASVICGALQPDIGKIYIEEKEEFLGSEGEGLKHRIVKVNQNPLLSESLTAKQNILLGKEFIFTSRQELSALEKKLDLLVAEWCPDLNLKKKVRHASAAERFYISLVGALSLEPEFLILDEPCSRLDFEQRENFYRNLRLYIEEKSKLSVLLITHSMNEAEKYADTITVLIKGKISAVYKDKREFDRNKFEFSKDVSFAHDSGPESGALRGTDVDSSFPAEGVAENRRFGARGRLSPSEEKIPLVMKVENLVARPKDMPALLDCSFEVAENSITLVAGHQESGLATLENILTGMEGFAGGFEKGKIHLYSKIPGNEEKIVDLEKKHLTAAEIRSFLRKGGTGILPTDKIYRGSHPELTVEQLLTANLESAETKKHAQKIIDKAKVQILPEEKVKALSGGMLQKLMIERELSGKPDFLILCNPLQGLDSAAESFFVNEMKRFVGGGKTILVLSSAEFPEKIADRIYRLESGVLKESSVQESSAK